MSRQKRRHHSAEQKATAVRRHLIDKVPVSDLCDELGIQPSLFYVWQRQVMDNLGALFDESRGGKRSQAARDRELAARDERIVALEAKLAKKDAVIADISEEHLKLKKRLG